MPPETNSAPSSAPVSTPSTNTSSSPQSGGEQKYNPFRSKEARESNTSPESSTPPEQTNHSVSGELSQPQTQQPPQAQPVVQPAQAQPQVVQMTPEMLARLIPQQPQQAAQTPQGPTQEEFNRRFNVAQVDAAQYEAIIGVAPDSQERVNALNQLLQGVAKQAVTMSRFLMEQQIGQLSQQLNPIQEQFTAQREEAYKRTFFEKHKDLSGHEPLLREIVESARLRGMSFPTAEEAMAYVSTTARKLLGAQNPQQPLSQSRPVQQTQVPMPSTMSNGRSGSGGAAKALPTAQRIFGRNDSR